MGWIGVMPTATESPEKFVVGSPFNQRLLPCLQTLMRECQYDAKR